MEDVDFGEAPRATDDDGALGGGGEEETSSRDFKKSRDAKERLFGGDEAYEEEGSDENVSTEQRAAGGTPFAHFLSKGIGIPPPGSPEKFQLPNASLAAPETTRPAVAKCRPSRALQHFFACGGGRGGRSEEKGQETQQGM